MKIRFYLSLIIAKLIYFILKITKLSSGTAIIGLITLKICPEFLVYANDYIKGAKINITGTNGKTTSSGIVSHVVSKSNKKVLTNALGANMLNGIVNALALQINPLNKFDFSIIETDEAFLDIVYRKMESNYLLVTNLFEDQTDRFESPLYTKSLIQKAIDKKSDIKLVLNADEPVSAGLKSLNLEPIYYGFDKIFDENDNVVSGDELNFACPNCGKILKYSKNFYSQVGHYSCECGYARPKVKYNAELKLYKKSSLITLDKEKFEVPLIGLFNAYNALGAISLLKELGINNINEKIQSFRVAFGRSEKRELNGHETIIQLIKNPAGTNEVLKTVDLESNILIAVNNNIADGRDISWIEQVKFERLANVKKEIVVTGLCASEMEKRLKKAGVEEVRIIKDIKKAVDYIGNNSCDDITILTTYTALLKIDKIKEMKKCF